MKRLLLFPSDSVMDFPTTGQLLVMGGDARIELHGGVNKYGCQPLPDPTLLAFASSTASVISVYGFAAAENLRERLLREIDSDTPEAVNKREMQRIRQELLKLCGVSDVDLVFARSGTDVHFIAAQYTASKTDRPIRVVMVEENETGSGVIAALTGKSLAEAPLDDPFIEQSRQNRGAIEVLPVPLRSADGIPRPLVDIDADVTALVNEALSTGLRVLVIMVDQSKTGLIAPSPSCVAQLLHRHADHIDVLVDACQFRIAPVTLNVYLQQGFMVALTGSKFLSGPSFSAALLLPTKARGFPNALRTRSNETNFGLLLRWEAALDELRRFCAVPQADVIHYLQAFAQAIRHRLMNDPHFEPLVVPPLDRRPLLDTQSWDQLPTIFPFLLYHMNTSGGRVPFNRFDTLQIYRDLQVDQSPLVGGIATLRCQFGQPVACGTRDGIAVSALRLCISARQISEAAAGKGISGVINEALAALDKTVVLIRS